MGSFAAAFSLPGLVGPVVRQHAEVGSVATGADTFTFSDDPLPWKKISGGLHL